MNTNRDRDRRRALVHQVVGNIPKGELTTPGMIAHAIGAWPRGIAPWICRHEDQATRFRVVLKGGWLPHRGNAKWEREDRARRAKQLKAEGWGFTPDGCRVIVTDDELWQPPSRRQR